MAKIILDFGSGNTCKNDLALVKRMIAALKDVDTHKHEIIIKWQLFEPVRGNVPLDEKVFDKAYKYAAKLGYRTTSSVFNKNKLDFLLRYDVPFIKISNYKDTHFLIGEIPRKIPVVVSCADTKEMSQYLIERNMEPLLCVSKYPATLEEYERAAQNMVGFLHVGVSDHTVNFDLWHKYTPDIIEWHYMLPESTGLDAGPFTKTPQMLAEVL